MSDIADINNRRNSLVGQVNNVVCYFGNLDSVTKVRLLKSYCSSFYGCELWDLWSCGVETFCKAWRQGQRAVWKLPYNTHRRFLPLMCDCIPIEDEICRRFLSFIYKSLSSQNELVKFVVRHGLMFGGMFSLCGRNALYCAERFGFNLSEILQGNFNPNIVKERYVEDYSMDDVSNVKFLMELTFLRDNIFLLPDFSRTNINDCIDYVCQM